MSYLDEIVREAREAGEQSTDPAVQRLANVVAVLCEQLDLRGAGGTNVTPPKRIYAQLKPRRDYSPPLFKKPE